MSHSLAPSEISGIFKLGIHGRSTYRRTGPNFSREYRDQRTVDLVRISKGGWMDPWTAESVQNFKKDCRDPRTADLVRFFKKVCRNPRTVESGHLLKVDTGINGPLIWSNFFKKVCWDPRTVMSGRFGPNFKKGMQGSTVHRFGLIFLKMYAGTHGWSNQVKFFKGDIGIHGRPNRSEF